MLQTKALYNLLRMRATEDPTVEAERWALEDLRPVPIEDLFSRLNQFKVSLQRHSFVQFANQCDTPEELTDLLLPDEAADSDRDPFYLVIFELWRRLLPEKQSLSVFCDELDHRISLYDLGAMESDEPIQDVLANLLEVLDDNADLGAEPEEIFRAVTEYCAHDLESFISDYISDLLDCGNSLYASELIEGFSPYVTDPLWLDFLKIRLTAFSDISDANMAMHHFLESEQEIELPLLLEIIRFLSVNGEHVLFKRAIQKALPHLVSQEELSEAIALIADFHRRLDEEDKEQTAKEILAKGKTGQLQTADIEKLQNLIL